ncbi:complement C4-like isoform X2 [Tympanuchus pallidicinctus]|uniref:complement C4-like isoform X2 n=1 Tax=Tympanuchus pallidicinctus TaxID=109042 RepID=UPI002286CF54|nr:complement C4-like isoform X2 [Tympanuchus pallidicinctus]
MGLRWAFSLFFLLFLTPLMDGSSQDPELVLVAPRRMALGTPMGLLVAAVGPVMGTVTAWAEGDRGAGPCALPVPFALTPHNNFNQLLHIEVTPVQAERCGALWGRGMLLEAHSPNLTPPITRSLHVALGGPRGHLIVQTDKPLYAPRQTVRFRVFSMDPDLQPNPEPILVTITNPLGARVREVQRVPLDTVLSDQLVLPDIALPGTWHIRAQLAASPSTNGSTAFEVRKYVLPGFEVRIRPERGFVVLSDPEPAPLRIHLHVQFPDGAPVWGRAQLRVGLRDAGGRGGRFLRGLEQQCQVTEGHASLEVSPVGVAKAAGVALTDLQGAQLRLAVGVVESAGGELVERELLVPLVRSQWALQLQRSARFFVPGAPYTLVGRVLQAGGGAAPGVPVRVTVGVTGASAPPLIELRADNSGDITVPINVPKGATRMELSVEAGQPGVPPARAQLLVTPMAAVSGRFLVLGGPRGSLHPGEELRLQLHHVGPPPAPQRFHLLAMARGRVVVAHTVASQVTLTEVALPVTADMAPYLHVVAFFLSGGNVVAASWGGAVQGGCDEQVQVKVPLRGTTLRPQDPLTVTVTTETPVTVAIGAIDTAVLSLEPRHRLNAAKVEAALGSSDLGCSPGGGPDAIGIFGAAGLVLGLQGGSPTVQAAPHCPPAPTRQRRSLELLKLLEEKAGPWRDNAVMWRCCRDGATALPIRATCQQRGQRVTTAGGCRDAFLQCCEVAQNLRRRGQRGGLARVLEAQLAEQLLDDDEDVPTRSFFPESWLWQRVRVAGTARLSVLLPDSITTWEIQAVAIVPRHGLCVAEPQRVTVTQDVRVALRLPPSIRPREQLQLQPLIHSRLPRSINVTVTLSAVDGVCAALDGVPQMLELPPGRAVAAPLTLVALQPGDIPITVTARGPWGLGDRVTRVLHVEPEGELLLEETTYVLDTDDKRSRSLELPGDVPAEIVPDGDFSMSIRVSGQVPGWALQGALGVGDSLLRSPRGCGEQSLMSMAPTAAALRFLDESEGWGQLPPGHRQRGLRTLQQGFERVQSFRKSDGSYGAWLHRDSSTWLTALVLRVLALSRPYLPVAASGPAASLRWVLGQQRPDGAFLEHRAVVHREMQGGVADPGPEATVSLTAFVVVALHGARTLLPPDSPELPLLDKSLSRASTFLRGRVEQLGTYGTAITAYALALVDTTPPGPHPAVERLRGMARSAHGGRATFWPSGGPAATVEATAYALLALLQSRDIAGAGRAARWLRQQSNYGGGFHSTQDTVVALEALAQMWLQWGRGSTAGLNLGLSWPGGARGRAGGTQVTLKPGLEPLEQELQVPLGSPVTVQVEGHGEGTLTVLRQFRLLSPPNATCQALHLEVAITGPILYHDEDYEDYEDYEEAEPKEGEEPTEGAVPMEGAGPVEGAGQADGPAPLSPMSLWDARKRRRRSTQSPAHEVAFLVCFRRSPGVALTGMAVVEISLLSGFSPHRADLDKLRDVVDRWISHYELDGNQLVLYLDEVPPERQCLSFGATQEVAVGHMQPAMAAIYDYYEPGQRCTVFYNAPQRSSTIATLCSPKICECAQGGCPHAQRRTQEVTADDRHDFACYSPRVDYALVVRVLSQSEIGAFMAFETEIKEVLLGGQDTTAAPGERRRLLVRKSCPLRLQPHNIYLVMGGSGGTQDPEGRPQFLLGPHSWVEEVPSPGRCRATRLRGHCAQLQEFCTRLSQLGCQL